jgi:hypothetical protein
MSRRSGAWVWREVWWPRPYSPDVAVELLERLAADSHLGELVFEAHATGGAVRYLLGARPGHIRGLTMLIGSLVPGTRLAAPTIKRTQLETTGHLSISHPERALDVDRVSAISRAILAGLASATEGEHVVLQLQVGGRVSPRFVPAGQRDGSWFDLLIGASQPTAADKRAAIKPRVAGHGFHATIRVGATAETPARVRELISGVLGGLRVAETAGVRLHFSVETPAKLHHAKRPWAWPLTLSAREVAPLLGWPLDRDLEKNLPGHHDPHPRVLPAPQTLKASPRPFAVTTAPGDPVRFGIDRQGSLQHTLLVGPTASGKSVAMLAMIEDAIADGRSVLVIDPKTDLVNDVLARVPENRRDDIVVIDPTDSRPVGLNPLRATAHNREQVVDALIAVFKELSYDSWGPRTQDVLTSALMTLTYHPDATLAMLPPMLTDDAFRRRVLRRVNDVGLASFWAGYEAMSAEQRAQVIAPTMTRLRQFLLRPTLRGVLGQAHPEFELRDLFTKRRIVLVSLNKGLLGSEGARLLGSLIVSQLWPLVLSRAAVDPARRHVVSVFIDEVQDYLTLPTDLADALAQARGLGVGFTLAHQYRKQLPTGLLAGVDANARNKIVFGLNGDDAAAFAKQAPGLDAQDFMRLPRFHVYATLQHGGHTTDWFSARTLPTSTAHADPVDIRAQSAARYGRPAEEVDEAIFGNDATTAPADPDGSDEAIGRRRANKEGPR